MKLQTDKLYKIKYRTSFLKDIQQSTLFTEFEKGIVFLVLEQMPFPPLHGWIHLGNDFYKCLLNGEVFYLSISESSIRWHCESLE